MDIVFNLIHIDIYSGGFMDTYTYHRVLPSCTLNRELLSGLEKRLLHGIPLMLQQGLQKVLQGLGLDSHKQLESYQIVINVGQEARSFSCTSELQNTYFEPGTKQVRVEYSLGAPRILALELIFPKDSQPTIKLTTQSPQMEKLLPRIAEGLCTVIEMYGNRHKVLHSCFIQAAVLFSMPAAVMAYGLIQGLDMFLLCSSMGWLCLISLGFTMALPHIFPWVTFESQRRFQWSRLPLLVRFSVLIYSACCYVGLVLMNLPSAS
jgi:hypothetical protein